MRKRCFAFSLILVIFFAGSVWADIYPTILKGEAVRDKKARLFVSVVDEAGRPIKGLRKENFKLLIEREEIPNFVVEPVSTIKSPLSIILGIDISGSMKGRPFQETQRAVSIFLDQLDREDQVSLMSFGTEVKFITEFIQERHKIREEVQKLKPVDMWTHLYDATYEAMGKGKKASTTRAAIILLTDGRDEGSKDRKRKEAVDIATGSSIPVFAIGFGHKIDREYLEEIAGVSGGYFLFTPVPEEIAGLYGKVLDQLKNQYMISFDFTKEPNPYKASVTLSYGGKLASAVKEFDFYPERLPPIIPIKYLIAGGSLLLVAIIILILIIYFKKNGGEPIQKVLEEVKRDLPKILRSVRTNECELEFPEEFPTPIEYLDSRSGGTTKLATDTPNVFLKVDCLGKDIPLVYKGVEILEELIIARKDREQFKKKGVVYLWTRTNIISGPKEGRPGHARIFLTEGERFAIEDLGSINGTFLGENDIKDKGPVLLQDGEVIEVGGKKGIRIVYRESEIEKDGYGETKIDA